MASFFLLVLCTSLLVSSYDVCLSFQAWFRAVSTSLCTSLIWIPHHVCVVRVSLCVILHRSQILRNSKKFLLKKTRFLLQSLASAVRSGGWQMRFCSCLVWFPGRAWLLPGVTTGRRMGGTALQKSWWQMSANGEERVLGSGLISSAFLRKGGEWMRLSNTVLFQLPSVLPDRQ